MWYLKFLENSKYNFRIFKSHLRNVNGSWCANDSWTIGSFDCDYNLYTKLEKLWIGLPQLLFMMFNVFLDSLIFIDVVLHIIPQQWPLLLIWLKKWWHIKILDGHYQCLNFDLSLCHHLYLALNEGDVTYDQQCDVILKLEQFWCWILSLTFDDKTFIFKFMGIWETNPFFIGIEKELMIQNQVPCSTSSSLNHTWCFKYMLFWIKKYHGTNVLILLVVTSLKVCERVYQIIWCLCTNKKFGSLLQLLIFASSWSSISMDFITNIVPSIHMNFF